MLCFMSKAIIKVVFTGLTILVVSSWMKISETRMNSQKPWHWVDESVLSPLHRSFEVSPEDLVSNASQVNSGHSGTSSSSSSSSKRRREAKIKAAISSLQAKQLAERVNRDNQVRELELQEEMAQRELEWQLECRKQELDLLRKKREDEMAVISAKDQAEAAQLESEMLGQEYNEGRDNEADKVSKPSSFSKHYLVPTPKEVESKDFKPGISQGYVSQELKGNVYLDRQAVTSYEHTPLCAVSKPPPVKNLEFHTAQNSSLTLGSVQAPAAKACELHMVKFTTATLSPQQGLYSFQTTATSASLNVKPSLYRDLSPLGYVTVSQPKPGSFDKTSTPPLTTPVTWTTYPGPGGEIPPKVSSLVGGASVVMVVMAT